VRQGRGAVGVVTLAALLLLASEHDAAAYVRYVTSAGMPFSLMPPCLPLPIVVYPGTYSEMTVEEITAAVTGAAAAWSAGTNSCTYLDFDVTVVSGRAPRTGNDGIRMVVFRDTSWCKLDASGVCDPSSTIYDPASLALTNVVASASTGRIVDADIEVNAHSFSFADKVAHPELTSRHDLQNLLTHEFGHMLGLDSSCYPAGVPNRPTDNTGQPVVDCATASAAVQATTMFPSTSPDDLQKRTLEPDDRAGVCAIYPAAASPCPAGGGSCACPPPGPDGGQDAGVDAGPNTNDDAGPNTDGRPADAGKKSSGGGCSCETAGQPSERCWPVLVFLAVALVATRRSSRGPRPEALN
jgi:hypothetical protein